MAKYKTESFLYLCHVIKGRRLSVWHRSNSDSFAMVVDLPPVFVWSHIVDKCMQQHIDPGDTLGKDEPDINHLDIGRRWKAA